MNIRIFKLVLVMVILMMVPTLRGQAATHQVEINQKMQFVPATLTIKAGDTVVWTNKSSMLHNVVSSPIKMRSKMLKKGDKFEFTFKQVGLVDYICEPHRAHMKGKVKVEK